MRLRPTWWWKLEGWQVALLTGSVVPGCVLSVFTTRMGEGFSMLDWLVSEMSLCLKSPSPLCQPSKRPAESPFGRIVDLF